MKVDPERIINRLLIGSGITMALWTLMTGDFDSVYCVMVLYAIVLFVQEDIYDFAREQKRKARRRARSRNRRESKRNISVDYKKRNTEKKRMEA